jgi:Uma2 family endonuclease
MSMDGVIKNPARMGKDSRLQIALTTTINQHVSPKNVAYAFPSLRCTFGEKSLTPAISVFTWARIPKDENGDVADDFLICPDWVIDILSPTENKTNKTKMIKNMGHCSTYGITMGWVLFVESKSVLVYPANEEPEIFWPSDEDPLPVPDFASSLQLKVGEVFSWLRV